MNYSNRINSVRSYINACKTIAGALAALVAVEYARPANAEELYLVKRSEKPALEQKNTESAEDFYDKSTAVITAPKTKKKKLQRLIADLSLGIDAGTEYRQMNTGAKLIITPDMDSNAWRAVVEATARAGTKSYSTGNDLNFGDFRAGARVGRYIDLRKFIEGTKAYAEAGAMLEGTEYQNRTEMSNYRILAMLALGLFSAKTGTSAKLTLAAGQGSYSLETAGTEQTDMLTRMLADIQIKQEIPGIKGPYGKARVSFTNTGYRNRADARVIAVEAGAGMQGKVGGLDAFVEALLTYRRENTEYFNGANTTNDIFGTRLLAGLRLTEDAIVKLGFRYDEELLFGLIAEIVLRLR